MLHILFALATRLQAEGHLSHAAWLYRLLLAIRPQLLGRGPDFLIIGAARCGTTWMKAQLARHPAVRIVAGEVHYFSRRTHISPGAYAALFTNENFKGGYMAVDGYVQGEKSPDYQVMSDRRIALCKALFPRAKIIFQVRDPVERAWSHLKRHGLPAGGETYDEIVRAGRFEHDLRRWARHYRDIHLVTFDDIRQRPSAVLDGVYDFLGVERVPYQIFKNRGPLAELPPSDVSPQFRELLEQAYRGERWDLHYLKSLVKRPSGGLPPGPPEALSVHLTPA